jgi:hypothetical protein
MPQKRWRQNYAMSKLCHVTHEKVAKLWPSNPLNCWWSGLFLRPSVAELNCLIVKCVCVCVALFGFKILPKQPVLKSEWPEWANFRHLCHFKIEAKQFCGPLCNWNGYVLSLKKQGYIHYICMLDNGQFFHKLTVFSTICTYTFMRCSIYFQVK